jgi:hypothetical protein
MHLQVCGGEEKGTNTRALFSPIRVDCNWSSTKSIVLLLSYFLP